MEGEIAFRKVPMREMLEKLSDEHRKRVFSQLKEMDPLVERGIMILRTEEHEEILNHIKRYSEASDKEEALETLIKILQRYMDKIKEYEMDEEGFEKIEPESIKHMF